MDSSKERIFEQYLAGIKDLPTLPYIVVQLLDKLHEANPDITELAELVMTDQVLTTKMIRLVNSVFFGLKREVCSIRDAIVYLGFREISNLVYSVSLTNTFERDAPLLKRVKFWEHSFGCALISKQLAQQIAYPDAELAYLAGLLHDIGETIIALHQYEAFEKVVQKVRTEKISFFDAEEEVLGINHTDFGEWLVNKWDLPLKLSEVVACHHTVKKAKDDDSLVAIVSLSDLICLYHRLDFGYPEIRKISSEIISIWQFLIDRFPKLTHVDLASFLKEFNQHIDEIKKTVARMYSEEEVPVS